MIRTRSPSLMSGLNGGMCDERLPSRRWTTPRALVMVCKGMGFVVVFSQLSKVAMDVVGIAALGFQLDGHVSNTEVDRDAGLDQLQQVE